MLNEYSIYKSDISSVSEAARELIAEIDKNRTPLRLVFFVKVSDNQQYLSTHDAVFHEINLVYGENRPLISVVAQAPLDAFMSLECCFASEGAQVELKWYDKVRYALSVEGINKFLMTEGILPSSLDSPMKQQAEEVFCTLEQILTTEEMEISSITRQWNYIEHIVGEKTPGLQNYQQLNDARSDFYSKVSWPEGYPAATGIGTQAGGIMVEVDAVRIGGGIKRIPIDNTLQVAAHAYSSDVLIGEVESKTTPKFERAKALVVGQKVMIYVSGTAAIRGEASLFGVGIERQTVTTLENIENLFSNKSLKENNIILERDLFVTNFRVYLKHAEDYEMACRVVSERYPSVPVVYVLSDVCRDELLVEIECLLLN